MKKKTTNFEAINDEDVMNKAYLDEKLLKIDGDISILERNQNEIKIHYNKPSVEEILVQRAVKTTIQIFYDERLFDNFPNAHSVLYDFLFVTRTRVDLEKIKDVVQ